jgi:DNA (cytosine-5)-methyltransferase 1
VTIKFSDLFCGIGGFHAVGEAFGWSNVYACDIDQQARKIYQKNWGTTPSIDITLDSNDEAVKVPKHDVLFAGFPCQPFSKSGKQRGMDEARGTLFWNIARILEKRRPKIVVLENVANLAGPRHRHEWEVILRTLRELGYRVSDEPLIISPHQIKRNHGGRPQNRPRIYILATYVPPRLRSKFPLSSNAADMQKVTLTKDEMDWNLKKDLDFKIMRGKENSESLKLSDNELYWLKIWEDLLKRFVFKKGENRLPGFPIWADVWLGNIQVRRNDPIWKKDFIFKNLDFYNSNRRKIDSWLKDSNYLETLPPSRRKFEWQAGDARSIFDCLIQLRPSGIRVKRANYSPAAVAITQTPILGHLKRKLSIEEVSYLQGIPNWFTFEEQADSHSYRQLGNGISIGAAYQAIRALINRDEEILRETIPEIVESVKKAPKNPDGALNSLRTGLL